MQTDIQKSNENVTSTTESKIIPLKKEYLAKIDVIPTVSFNKEQKAIAKKIIENTDEKDLNAVFSLITQRVKTGFVFDEAPEVNHDCVALVKENENLNINIGVLSEMEGKIEHKLIIGENYDALKNLCATYIDKSGKGLIDVIYIDPPYNTEATKKDGNDYKEEVTATKFIYRDKFTRDGWLNMMNERLKLAKRLLSEKGVIFISIDDSEQAYLKVLCDEVFGEGNFVACAPRKTGAGDAASRADYELRKPFDFVLIYSKSKINLKFNKKIIGQKEYKYSDNKGKYLLAPFQATGSDATKAARPNLYYPIYVQKDNSLQLEKDINTINEILPNKIQDDDGRWMWSPEKFSKDSKALLVLSGNELSRKVYYDKDKDQNIYQIEKAYFDNFFYEENEDKIVEKLEKLELDKSWYRNANGTKALKEIMNAKKFNNPKPVFLIKHLIKIVSNPNSLILDFFAGSGTTGQAVMELNEEDGGNRKFILVTNNENSIGEKITRERLYRVINGTGSNGETITWTYSKEKPYLQNNAVRVFNIEHTPLTLNDLDKAEQLKETALKEFVKLNPLYTAANEFDIYNELAALNPQKEILQQSKADAEAKK